MGLRLSATDGMSEGIERWASKLLVMGFIDNKKNIIE